MLYIPPILFIARCSFRAKENESKKNEKTNLRINDVARMVDLSQKRIREYESEGLVKPLREPRTNNRMYSQQDITRIRRIKALIHQHGFTLSCLKYFLASAPCWIIFNCAERTNCLAYKTRQKPCYEVMQTADASHIDKCQSCAVYMNRVLKSFPLFDKT